MIKNWNKFNEGWFSKKEDESNDITPKGIISSTGRPTPEETERLERDLDNLKSKKLEPKVDSDFLQEVSDRLYGPDSDEYIKALKELNASFRPREGKYVRQFFDPSSDLERRRKEHEIVLKSRKDN
jgi:hypothetical protein